MSASCHSPEDPGEHPDLEQHGDGPLALALARELAGHNAVRGAAALLVQQDLRPHTGTIA